MFSSDALPQLILDCFLDDNGCPDVFLPRDSADHVSIRAAQVPLEQVPTQAAGYSRILISGSSAFVHEERPWSLRLETLIRSAAVCGVPVLGVCYGHQLIAKALWGPGAVRVAPHPEFGWHKITPSKSSSFLTRALSASGLHAADDTDNCGSFRCFLSHRDEVVADVSNYELEVLASSRRCSVQAFAVAGLPIWGAQFHSELPHKDAYDLFQLRASQYPELDIDINEMLARAVDRHQLWESLHTAFCQIQKVSRAA